MTDLADPPRTATTIPVVDPSTGEALGEIPAGSPEAVDLAVDRARAAFAGWARTPAGERATALKAAVRALRAPGVVEELAVLQSREGGKPLGQSRGGVEAGIGALEQYAELGPLHRGHALQGAGEAVDVMRREPRGVAALLVPWNDPLAIACQGLAALLAAGNAVVFKPSERTPLSAQRLVELLAPELPEDVLVLVHGDARAGRPLVAHPDVDLVLHTGSVPTGLEIAAVCARTLKKAVLELGGKDALIVDEGVDPRWAAEQAASGAFVNAGQVCTSVERVYVHEAVADRFVTELVRCARELRVGAALEEDVEMGPLVDGTQRALVAEHVDDALARGARALCGGDDGDAGAGGCFYPPTVLVDVDDDMRIMREETFGPVAAVRVVGSFTEALERANATEYGLAASVLTPSQANAARAAAELRVGTVKVNAVWGGAPGGAAQPQGRSGVGFGYGPELLDEVTTTKVVHLEAAPGG